MDPVALEMMSVYSGDPLDLMDIEDQARIAHGSTYEAQGAGAHGPGGRTKEASSNGIGSGRYERGSGDKPYQSGINGFLERVDYHKKRGVTNQKELAALCGCVNRNGEGNTTSFRIEYQKALHDWKRDRAAKAQSMIDSGMSKKEAVISIVINISYPSCLVSALRFHSGINSVAAAYGIGIKESLVISAGLSLIAGITGTVESSYRSAVILHCCSCRNGCTEQHDSCACYYSCLR